MLYREILTEMIWEDRFEAAKVARRHPRAWIHFSHINKLGVHPAKGHHDPPGIYFYPVQWLFSDKASLSQFATEYEYFFIVRFNRASNIINLGKMTMDDVKRIAIASNWIDDLHAIEANPKLLANDQQPMAKRLLKRPGGLFYAAIDYLANVKGRPWLGLMKGCDGLYDPGFGFISAGEIAQAVVFGRQHLTIVAQGDNKDHGDREYAGILRQIATEMGGKFYFRNKLPVAEFDNDGRPFRFTLKLSSWGMIESAYYSQGFWFVNQEKYDTYAGDRSSHYQNIKYYVIKAAKAAEPAGTKMYWTGESGRALLDALRPSTRSYQRIGDDGLNLWSNDSYGNIYASLRAIISPQDQITVQAELDLYHEIECKVSRTFGQEPIAACAKIILDDLAQQLIEKTPNPRALKSGRLGGFVFGDRFNI